MAGLESRPPVAAPAARPTVAPLPVARYEFEPASDRLATEPVGSGSPMPSTEDLFADLALPTRSSATRKPPAADEPVPPRAPTPPAPPRVQPPRQPEPARAQSSPARAEAPPSRPRVPARPVEVAPAPASVAPMPDSDADPNEGRPRRSLAPLLIGIAAFLAGIVVAVVVVMRIGALGGKTGARNPQEVVAPVSNSPSAPAEAPPRVQVEVAPQVIHAPVAVVKPAPRPKPRTRPRNPDEGAALNSPSTTVIPTRVIHSEEVVPSKPTESAPAPPAPPPAAELGVLCGLVKDSDGHPVARAQVMMADVGVVVLTDRAGHFCLTAPAGERTLSVVALGFTPSRRLVTLAKRTAELRPRASPLRSPDSRLKCRCRGPITLDEWQGCGSRDPRAVSGHRHQ